MKLSDTIKMMLKSGQRITTRDIMREYGMTNTSVRKQIGSCLSEFCQLGLAYRDGEWRDGSARGVYYASKKGVIEEYEEKVARIKRENAQRSSTRAQQLREERKIAMALSGDNVCNKVLELLSSGKSYTSIQIRDCAAPYLTASGMSSRLSSFAVKGLVRREQSYPSVKWVIVTDAERKAEQAAFKTVKGARIFKLMDTRHTYPAQTGNTRPSADNFGL